MATASDFLKRLDRILVFKRGHQRAPHKPLYLLFCIASVQQQRPRLQSFDTVRHALFFDDRAVGIEAAHIFWPQAGGNDRVGNGIAMTALHRKLYHLGLFGIGKDLRIRVSPYAKEASDSPLSLKRLNGQKIRLP